MAPTTPAELFKLDDGSISSRPLKQTMAEGIKACVNCFGGVLFILRITRQIMRQLIAIYTDTGHIGAREEVKDLRLGDNVIVGSLRDTLVLGITETLERYDSSKPGGGPSFDNLEACQSVFSAVEDALDPEGAGKLDGTEGIESSSEEESSDE